jgi:site-specific DNA-methyltransferase (adenine-specific)
VGISNNAGRGLDMELNQIYHMDCLEGMKDIPDKSIDMILCDLPYGTTACKWDTVIPFNPLWSQYERIVKDNGAIVLTASQPFTSVLVMSNPKLFKYEWIWEKDKPSNFALAKRQPLKYHESILIFYKNQSTYNRQMIERSLEGKTKIERMQRNKVTIKHNRSDHFLSSFNEIDANVYEEKKKNPSSLLKFNLERNNQYKKQVFHPTQKPVALFEYLIRTYTDESETVLDNCMGSGTTAIACINTGRFFIGFEKELEYVEIANKRINEVFPGIGTTEPLSVAAAVGGC